MSSLKHKCFFKVPEGITMGSMSELIDLVDRNGTVIQRGIVRDDANAYDGLHMQIVIVVILDSHGHTLVHQRAKTKRVNPGDIDHVCGAMLAGETPEAAAQREASEEVGVTLRNLQIVRQGVNSYGRFCYLLSAISDDMPAGIHDPEEVEWVAYHAPEALRRGFATGKLTFVDGFFEDLEHALAAQ